MNHAGPAATTPATSGRQVLWLLALVPQGRGGRWWAGLGIFIVLLGVFAAAGALSEQDRQPAWPAALFFCAIIAYVTPVFHFITRRTEDAFDALTPSLPFDSAQLAKLRSKISSKRPSWYVINTLIGVFAWLAQSRLLAGSFEAMMRSLADWPGDTVMAIGPLFVWLFMSCSVHALIDNARLFRKLGRRVKVDLLDTRRLNPFGSMAVSSTLMVIGAQALFPIMWLGPETDIWTTVPGMVPTTIALLFLFFAPVWPIHLALRGVKQAELKRLQTEIDAAADPGVDTQDYAALAPLLVYRREIASTPEWPFDLSIVARFGLYLVIVPLTWIGAALIEILVDVFLDGGP